jgi:TRAP-type transport system small permease protein
VISKLIDLYARFLIGLLIFLMFVLLAAVGLTVAGRYIPFVPRYFWTLEVTNFSLIWMVFIGSIIGVRDSRHFFIDIFSDNMPAWFDVILKAIYYIVTLTVTYVFVRHGFRFFREWGLIQTSDLTGINLGFLYASVPFAGVSWLIFLLQQLYRDIFVRDQHPEHHMSDSYTIHHDENTQTEGENDV